MSSSLNADNTASTNVTVSGDIIASLSITSVEPIKFGEIAAAEGIEPTVEIVIGVTDQNTGSFTVAYTGNSSPDVSETGTGTGGSIAASGNRSIIAPGVVNVSGEVGYNYIATLRSNGIFSGGTTAGVNVRALFTSGGATTQSRVIAVGGTDKLYVGGRLTAINGANVGSIVPGSVSVVVTYD